MGEITGLTMDLTGLSAKTLVQLQDLLARRMDMIERQKATNSEVPDLTELPGLTDAYRQVNAAWFNRISWTSRRFMSVTVDE